MASNAPDMNPSKKRKSQEPQRCPACGRRQVNRTPRYRPGSEDWEAGDLEQLVESMDLGEIAALLGLPRYELVKRCRSLGIPVDGSGEENE